MAPACTTDRAFDHLGRRRALNIVTGALLLCFALAPMVPAYAQAGGGGAAGSIIGQVKDESGAVLPGVTVTATSSVLQVGQLTAVTDAQGEYRITPLPAGTYVVEYSLAGFETVRVENVQMTIGFTARLDETMKVGSLEEKVTVSGESPLIDVASAASRTNLKGEDVAMIPSGKIGVESLLALVPGARSNIDVGGSAATATAAFVAFGQTGSAWQLLEGVLSTGLANTGSATAWASDAVDAARVQTLGNNAETPGRGILLDVVTKSGGNELHGAARYAQSSSAIQSNNIDETQEAQGITRSPKIHIRLDTDAQVGGKIIRDKLWYFADYRYRLTEDEALGAFNPDGSPFLHRDPQLFGVGKVSSQLGKSNKLIGFIHAVGAGELRGPTNLVSVDARELREQHYYTTKGEWQTVPSNWFTASFQTGVFWTHSWTEGFSPNLTSVRDLTTLKVGGESFNTGQDGGQHNIHNRGTATIYKPNLFAGNHEFKVGFDNLNQQSWSGRRAKDSGDYQLLFQNGTPSQLSTFSRNHPETFSTYIGIYGQDSWTIARRLTLDVGVRVSHDALRIPAGCDVGTEFVTQPKCYDEVFPNAFNSVVPRLHFVYDLLGDAKTTIRGGWGRFARIRYAGSADVLPYNWTSNATTTWTWHDNNGDKAYQPGEVNLDPNGTDFVSFGSLVRGVVNPNEKVPMSDEFTLGFDRQLTTDMAVRVTGVYAKNTHVNRNANPLIPYDVYTIPITNKDPGPDNILNNADDPGTSVTYYEYPTQFRGAKFVTSTIVNDDPRSDNDYKSIELAVTKRLSSNWQFAGSYSATKKHEPFGDGLTTGTSYNPNAEINISDNTWVWISKFSGTYMFPKGFIGSANFDYRNGDRLARQVQFRGGVTIPNIVLNVEPIGSLSLDPIKLLDLRAAKTFRLGGDMAFEARVDCFNALNENTATVITVRSGSTYLTPTTILLPRILQFEGRFTF